MTLLRKRTADDAAPGERACRGCGGSLADDQLACLQCGAVDEPAGGRERRWMLPTGGLVGVGLFLVTSASFAATTALNTGDPTAIKQPTPPAVVAQAPPPATAPLPPASGDGTAPKVPDLAPAPAAPAPAPKAPAAPATPKAPAAGGDSGGSSGGNSNGDSGSSGGKKDDKTKTPEPVKVATWPAGQEGYTVIVYKFDSKREAKAKASEVAAAGLPAGILDSSGFASLDPGSWLVYIGEFDSAKQADKAGQKYENAGYPGEVTFVGDTPSPEYQPPAEPAPSGGDATTPQP
jgi:hypothetical protein